MSENAPSTFEPDVPPQRSLPSWPWLTMILNFALMATIFVTRERWEAWQVEADLPEMLETVGDVEQIPGGRRALIHGSKGVCLWDIEGARAVACFGRSRQPFDKWAASPRGDVVAVARNRMERRGRWGQCRELELIDADTGRATCRLDFEPGAAWSMANHLTFSHTGDLLALGLYDGRAVVWRISTGERLYTLGGQQNICSMAFSDDDSLLVTASHSTDDTVYVWDVRSGECLMKCCGGYFCGFCGNGRNIVTKESRTSNCWLWDVAARTKLATWSTMYFAIPSTDGATVRLERLDGLVDIRDAETGEAVALGITPEPGRMSPDGRWRVFYDSNRALTIASTGSEHPAIAFPPTAPSFVWSYKFLGDGERLVTWAGNYEGRTRVWSLPGGQEVAGFNCKERPFVLGPRRIVVSIEHGKWCVIARIRPEPWWGVFWLPHFWLIAALGGCVFLSGWRDVRRMRRHEREAA